MKKYNIGVDIGASHVSCGLYNIYEKRLEHKIYYRKCKNDLCNT